MPNQRAADLIAQRLSAGLVHPGNPDNNQPAKLIPLPGLSNLGIPPAQAAHFAKEAGLPTNDAPKLIAEAIVHLLETDGAMEIIDRAELEQLRAEAATLDQVDPTAPTAALHCHCNHQQPILKVAIGRPMVLIDGATLRKALDEVCTCG